jgi:hypothetical protein
MTALGVVLCNGCRACCLHDMIPLMPERGDLIWTYRHEVIATAAGPTAVLQRGEAGRSIVGICFSARPAPNALRW